MIDASYPGNSMIWLNPNRTIIDWYDIFHDPFWVIKKKCKPTFPTEWENCEVQEICYIAGIFSEDKIKSPSFADEKDTVLNNIILAPNDELLQMYFMTDRDSTVLWDKWMFKICVREYKRWKEVVARQFISRLQ